MVNIRNCVRCGKIFAYDGINKICPQCRQQDEEEFKKVRDYIYQHPEATIQVISEETGVEVKKILKYLREGRLELKDDNVNLLLDCERCGKSIKSGRFCETCTQELEKELKSAAAKNSGIATKKTDKDKMFIAERYKR